MSRPRIALFVLEALPNARAVRRFVAEHAADIAFVGLSNAERPSTGGLVGQVRRHLARSGPGFLPYLAVNFGLPDLLAPAAGLIQRLAGTTGRAGATPLRALCRDLDIPTLRVDDVNGTEVAATIGRHQPDLIVAFHFDQIFSGPTLARVRLGGLNVHPGLLPRHRGPVPTIHALAEEPPAFGVTVHHLAVTIDAGAILAQEAVALPPGTTATRASVLLHEHGRILLDRVLARIDLSGAIPEGETAAVLPYCPFPDRSLLADLKRRGRKLTDRADLADALALHTRG
ncbi:formyl transferase [Methylobacterium sp. Leaf399]|uniref:formyltransferase family protein n=1 Tax=unclassified Methylobacterium TaxID=2615210 RepID=UPI000701D546|nr:MULTISPECIES: formyltransferase family protein [unclassified Methylobacterium]KQP56259.1 formyl transferase [Methylobacterium sp. Leaf108]KQT19030.1 formyl transferase [Methylobacterium sp. Leaf399]KQT85672.1 formyl transferase [Methylobacterium sp. Leaf466]